MLHGLIRDPSTTEPLRCHPTWRLVLAWLGSIPPDIALGRVNIYHETIFAIVQSYDTLDRDRCRFESHREHVDLQYTISGAEIIDWAPRSMLQPDGDFSIEKDVGFWQPPAEPVTGLIQRPGCFAVFYPEDAHRPKVRIAASEPIRKLVVKIPVRLLE